MSKTSWVDVQRIKLLVRETVTKLIAILAFAAVKYVLIFVITDPTIRGLVTKCDDYVLLGLFILLGFQLLRSFWKGGVSKHEGFFEIGIA
jgi:hypothetical protein